MKALRALMLVLTLSVCAYAGDMDNGRPASGPMDNGVTASPTPATAEGSDSSIANAPAAETLITEVALSLLQSILSVF